MSARRLYRNAAGDKNFRSFTVAVKETDLWIAVPADSYSEALPGRTEELVWRLRRQLESYIETHPDFALTREPYLAEGAAPEVALQMIHAGNTVGVGPMAAVAGALAEAVGERLLRHCSQVIVENGGDIFMNTVEPVRVAVLAGKSPLSKKIALLVEPDGCSCGICTSSGTTGHAYSRGKADAAVILSPSAALADAAATAAGNLVQEPADLEGALSFARSVSGITGALFICGDRIALWGQLQIQPLTWEDRVEG